MANLLFISPADLSAANIYNGGDYGSKIHIDLLNSIPDINLTVLSLSRKIKQQDNKSGIIFIPATKNKWDTLINTIRGYSSYLTHKAEKIVFQYIKSQKYDILFLDSSLFGRIAKKTKRIHPNIRIITFFHNIEYLYAISVLRISGLQYLPMLFANWYNEKASIKYSDSLIAINDRDRLALNKKYNASIGAILPPFYEDYELPEKDVKITCPLEVLFFGSWFHANIAGIKWFIDNVLPRADIKLTVAGRGMEKLNQFYHNSEKLIILGTITDVDSMYRQADIVVNPVFDGSGMKIKTGEALRYGKTIVGTHEAFSGYNITHGVEGYICETADDFLEAFKKIGIRQQSKINNAAYTYFKSFLTKEVAVKNLSNIIFKKNI
jgi:glycosyltransferase involved in cell wall biosynthesis